MMKIKPTPHFKRSFKKYSKKHYPMKKINDCIEAIMAQDKSFLKKHKDHNLIGKYRELHIDRSFNDDWLLIYSFDSELQEIVLVLVDIGSHNQLSHIIDL